MNVWGHAEGMSGGWSVLKSGVWEGRPLSDIREADPDIQSILSQYKPGTKLPPLPWKEGRTTKVPWKAIRDEGIGFSDLEGFTNPEGNMLPAPLNWIGGKTLIMPHLRGIRQKLNGDFIPAELFGGSGSFIFGMNDPQARGLYADINPDLTNLMQHLKQGIGEVRIPGDPEEMQGMIDRMNELRQRRDVGGQTLAGHQSQELARLLLGTNLQQRNGLFQYEPWGSEAVGYTEGRIKKPSFRRAGTGGNYRVMPWEVGSLDYGPYAERLANVDIHTGSISDTARHLTPEHLLYLDPPYISRDINYGGSAEQGAGKTLDDLQMETLRIGAEHEGPVILSNYLYDKNTLEPLHEYIDAMKEYGYTIYPWLRKPKGNRDPQVEVIATRNIPTDTQSALW